MALPDYNYLYDHACERKGGEKASKRCCPNQERSAAHKAGLGSLPCRVHARSFSRVWRVVDNKWPQFEEVFWEFDVSASDDARRHDGA